ncbi:MAG: hypothetical protein LBU31_02460 [Coriobacteriales bacterium]|jgi:hypothetical protein|nr:hypothetical protein [Coriobacteriales bacterium]
MTSPTLKSALKAGIPRIALALLLVASLMPLVNLAQGSQGIVQAQAADTSAAGDMAVATGTATAGDKDEVVYALLDGSGAPGTGYVVNHFPIEVAGTLTDQGRYDSVENLTSTQNLTASGGTVQTAVEQGDFYYEGVLSTVELPWLIDIAYALDGVAVQAAELAGASGQLTVRIQTRRNPRVDARYFDNYLLQVQVTLDSALAKGIDAPEATIASAGRDQQVAFMVLPGREGDLTLKARVTDFEMPGIQISGLPFSMVFDVPDTTSMLNDMQTLTDAIAALNSGVAALESGVADMQGGAARLASGSADLNAGLTLLRRNSGGLIAASAQIDVALAQIAQGMRDAPLDPDEMAELVEVLRLLSAGLSSSDPKQPGLAEGLTSVQGGVMAATGMMEGSMRKLIPVDASSIGELYGDPGYRDLEKGSKRIIDDLRNVNTQAQYVWGAWYGPSGNDGVKAGLDAAAGGLGASVSTCKSMAGALTEVADGLETGFEALAGLKVLAGYLEELSSTYAAFDSGLAAYAGGVDAIADNYAIFDSGLSAFVDGVTGLYSGVSALHDGSNRLSIETEDLPATLQAQIDSFLDSYRVNDFEPASFVAPDNHRVARVQFVLRSDPIEIPAPTTSAADDTPAESSLWDRLKALF